MSKSGLHAVVIGMCLIPFVAAPGRAEILGVLTNATAQFAGDNEKHQLALDDNGDTSFTFQGERGGPTVFTFNAACVANGPAGGFVTINITVDGHPTDPHAAHDRAFCSSGTSVSAVHMTSFTFVGRRPHTVKVFATGVGTATWRLGNTLFSVQD